MKWGQQTQPDNTASQASKAQTDLKDAKWFSKTRFRMP